MTTDNNSDYELWDGCCDCSNDCQEPWLLRRYHDCGAIEKLFKHLDCDVLQKLFDKVQYVCSISSEAVSEERVVITKNCVKKKTIEQKKKPLTEHNLYGSNWSDGEDFEYVDVDTGRAVPLPSEKKPWLGDSEESGSDEKPKGLKRKRGKKRKKKERDEIQVDPRQQITTKEDYYRKFGTQHEEYKCPHSPCVYQTKFFHYLKKHEKRSHLSERPVCSWPGCDKTFESIRGMRRHVDCFHRNKKPYKCTYPDCDKAYTGAQMLAERLAVCDFTRGQRGATTKTSFVEC